jgi:N-acetylmuramoyl-L-alanine amidase
MRYLQYRVGTTPDGIYGRQTEAAIKRYQQQNGLTADGIIGPATWGKLLG